MLDWKTSRTDWKERISSRRAILAAGRHAAEIGALDEGIKEYSQAPPSMYLLPDGRGYTPPDIAGRMKADSAAIVNEFVEKRERLRRFLLPFTLNSYNLLSIAAARREGRHQFQECITAQTETCRRVRACLNSDGLPY